MKISVSLFVGLDQVQTSDPFQPQQPSKSKSSLQEATIRRKQDHLLQFLSFFERAQQINS